MVENEIITIAKTQNDFKRIFESEIPLKKTGMVSLLKHAVDHDKDIMDRSWITLNLFLKF